MQADHHANKVNIQLTEKDILFQMFLFSIKPY